MPNVSAQALGLIRFAEGLAARGEKKTALVIDVSGIPEVNDPMFFRSLVRYVEECAGDLHHDAMPLARHFISLLADPEPARKIRFRLEQLSDYLSEQQHGSLRVQSFDLSTDAKRFVDLCRRLIEQAPLPPADRSIRIKDPPPPSISDVDHFLQVQRSLAQADISSLVRSRELWRLETNRPPEVFGRDVWVSIPALESRIEMPLIGNHWLFGRTQELADHRLISYLLHEIKRPEIPLSVSLRIATVFSADFRRLASSSGSEMSRPMIFELGLDDRRANADIFEKAVSLLRDFRFRVALGNVHGSDLANLAPADYEPIDWIKLDAAVMQGTDKQQLDRIAAIGPQRFILCGCLDEATVKAGLAAGIRCFQGLAVTTLMAQQTVVERLLGAGAVAQKK